ncbi:hypothetical protein VCV18_012214 [Metarhizium anisopliae]
MTANATPAATSTCATGGVYRPIEPSNMQQSASSRNGSYESQDKRQHPQGLLERICPFCESEVEREKIQRYCVGRACAGRARQQSPHAELGAGVKKQATPFNIRPKV